MPTKKVVKKDEGLGVAKKGKDDVSDNEMLDENGKDAVDKPESKVGKGDAKRASKELETKKAPKRTGTEENEASSKQKKVSKNDIQPRRGGERAAKKAAVENITEKKLVKKRTTKTKVAAKSRGRVQKKAKADAVIEDDGETSENAASVAVEH